MESKLKRDVHVAGMTRGRHGPMPWEFPASGGAYVVVDTVSRKIVRAQSLRLYSTGLGTDSSTVAETRTSAIGIDDTTEMASPGQPLEDPKPPAPIPEANKLLWVTDNDASVKSFISHHVEGTTEQRMVMSVIADPLRSIGKSMEKAQQFGLTIDMMHDHNEHGRPWDADRQTLTCRLLRCCDSAAGYARRWEEPRSAEKVKL